MVPIFSLTGDGLVLRTVAVRVANEACLPMVVQLGIGDSNTGDAVGEVEQTIIAGLNDGKLYKTM